MQSAECKMQNFGPAAQFYKGVVIMDKNIIESKSFDFAVRIINLYKYLTTEKKEFVLSKQLLKCGTSIGANVSEAEKGQSKADFNAKMNIALKEANETYYWLRLLYATEYLMEKEFTSLEKDINEILSILIAICKKTNSNKEQTDGVF